MFYSNPKIILWIGTVNIHTHQNIYNRRSNILEYHNSNRQYTDQIDDMLVRVLIDVLAAANMLVMCWEPPVLILTRLWK